MFEKQLRTEHADLAWILGLDMNLDYFYFLEARICGSPQNAQV